MYHLAGVTKRYTRGKKQIEALSGVDLTIEDGGRLVIQGPTGGGKSTLLQMLGGLDRPTEGSVEFDGVDLAKLSESRLTKVRAQSIGFVFQSFNLIPPHGAGERRDGPRTARPQGRRPARTGGAGAGVGRTRRAIRPSSR